MSEAVNDAVVSNVDKITDFAVNQMNQLIEGVKSTAPAVANGVLVVTQITAGSTIFTGIILAIVSFVFYKVGRRLVPWSLKYDEKFPNSEPFPALYIPVISYGLSIALCIFAVCNLLSFWAWVGLFKPEVYLAHQVIERVLEKDKK